MIHILQAIYQIIYYPSIHLPANKLIIPMFSSFTTYDSRIDEKRYQYEQHLHYKHIGSKWACFLACDSSSWVENPPDWSSEKGVCTSLYISQPIFPDSQLFNSLINLNQKYVFIMFFDCLLRIYLFLLLTILMITIHIRLTNQLPCTFIWFILIRFVIISLVPNYGTIRGII